MRILGIDLGSGNVKAVEIDSAFRRYEIHEYHEERVGADEDPAAAAGRLVARLPKKPDRTVVILRTGRATFRTLKLPLKDRKSILPAIEYELEDELPYELSESVYDYSILSTGSQGSQVHVASTLRKYVAELIQKLETAGIDPDIVTTETWAYKTLFNHILSKSDQENPVLLIQIGKRSSTYYVHWLGFPVLSREVNWGGDDVTQALAERYSIGPEDAERAKIDNGFVLPEEQRASATPEQAEFSDSISETLQKILFEIRQADLTCSNVTHRGISAIYLAGGASLLPGLRAVIEERSQIRTVPLQGMSAVAMSGVTYSEHTDATFALAVGAALCQVGPERSSVVNLRKGDLSRQRGPGALTAEALRKPAYGAAAVLVSMIASLVVQNMTYEDRITEIDARLERSLRTFLGTLSKSAFTTYLSNSKRVRERVDGDIDKQRKLGALLGPNPKSPVDFLREVSARVPSSVVVDLVKFTVGSAREQPYQADAPAKASLTFIVKDPQTAERLTGAIGAVLDGVERSPMEETKGLDGSGGHWKVTFTGTPKEGAYGR